MLSTEILELVAKLGDIVKNDARVIEKNRLADEYSKDASLAKAITEYNAQQTALSEAYKSAETDGLLTEAIENRLNELYHEIVDSPVYSAYIAAEEEANAFLSEINGELTFAITGSYPCSHNCGSCGGGCGHDHSCDHDHSHE